ncbi:uncharacterized protein [Malus domestica]|uniref:uncharacterized protein isoform X1 n=1 Tax=Malus domestica TaxID=3750 RepID=UPI003975B66D
MESDVPLIEIAGEDDSLLQLTHGDTVSSSSTSKISKDDAFFFCSPLQTRRSKPLEGVVVSENSKKPSSTLCRENANANKENTVANKLEEQKLSLLPQQMKRKKKGGGYNLRKSLAWDRAFFTDEGVLNSEELSMISGNANSNGLLSVIEEDTNSITDSADLHVIEENLFKVLPESPSNKKDRTVGGSPLPKHDSSAKDKVAPGSAAKRKVLSARDINRSGSKRSGCPRPVASSSVKRPANVNTMKSPIKEPKVSKIPVPRPDSCLLSRTSKNVTVGANDLKRNQIAHPAVKLNDTKSGPNNAKVTPNGNFLTSKSSVRQARRNVASLVKGSPTKISCPPTFEANKGLEGISKQAVPSNGHAAYGLVDRSRKTAVPHRIPMQALPSTAHASRGRNDRSRKPAVPEVNSKQALPSTKHASYCCDDRSRKTVVPLPLSGVEHPRPPTSKPSGLRMPSPSLGFFHQPKPSSLPSPLKTSSQSCVIPNLRQAGPVDPIHEFQLSSSVGEKQNVTMDGTITGYNDVTITGKNDVHCSSLDCSVLSIVNPATNKMVESFSLVTDMQKADLKVRSSPSNCDMTDNKQKFDMIPVHEDQISMGQAEPYITEKVVHMEKFKRNEDKLLSQRGTCEQLDEDDNSMNVAFVLPPKIKDTDKSQVTSHLSSTVKFPGVFGRVITDHQLLEDKPIVSPQKNCCVFSKSKSEDASSVNSTSVSYVDQSSGDRDNKLHGEQGDLSKPLTCEGDQMVWENSGSFTKECQTSEEMQTYSCVKVADVSPKVQNSSATDSDALCDSGFGDRSNNGGTFDKMSENPQEEDAQMLTLSGRLTDEMDDADRRTSASDNCQLVKTDCGNKKPEQLDLSNSCYIGEQVFQENILRLDDCVLDRFSTIPEESRQKIALQCVDLKETHGTGACRNESEVSKTLSLMPPAMPDCRSNGAAIVESQDNFASVLEDKAMVESYNLDPRNDSQLNCQDCCLKLESVDEVQAIGEVTAMDASFWKSRDFTSQLNLKVLFQDTSVEPNNLMGDKINFSGEEISVMNASCLNAEDRILNQSPEVHVSSLEGRESFEEPLMDNTGNCADISSQVNDLGGSGSQSTHGLSKHKILDEENKQVDEGSDIMKELALGDLREHTSVSNYACSAVVNNVYEEVAGCPELHHPNIDVIRVSQDIYPGSCLNGTLLANNSSRKDFVETVHEVVFNDYNACGSETKSSIVGPAMHDCTPDLEEKADFLQMEVAEGFSHDYKLSSQAASLEADSFATTTTGETSVSTLALNAWGGELCSSVISDRTSSSGSILQDNEVNALKGNLAEESEIDFNNHTFNSELQHELEDSLHPAEDKEATNELKKSGSDRKPEGLVIKPPSDAVPFSDEWLAALEAAGEEILTKKSGAVQNSPPNKSQPQLGPWSPVKRKANQVIGPFDCTKHTNNVPSTSQ